MARASTKDRIGTPCIIFAASLERVLSLYLLPCGERNAPHWLDLTNEQRDEHIRRYAELLERQRHCRDKMSHQGNYLRRAVKFHDKLTRNLPPAPRAACRAVTVAASDPDLR